MNEYRQYSNYSAKMSSTIAVIIRPEKFPDELLIIDSHLGMETLVDLVDIETNKIQMRTVIRRDFTIEELNAVLKKFKFAGNRNILRNTNLLTKKLASGSPIEVYMNPDDYYL